MSVASVAFEIDTSALPSVTDDHLAALWHIAQANPAPITDRAAIDLAEAIGREIIRRWLASVPPRLWRHQGRHAAIEWREVATELAAKVRT